MSYKTGKYLVIWNIPLQLNVRDLRSFFGTAIEKNIFICFHYRHVRRKKDQKDHNSLFSRVICVVKAQESENFIQRFHEKFWMTSEGVFLDCVCCIRTATDKESQKITSGPNLLPQGNVGTPWKYIQQKITSCRLSTALLKRLGLNFTRDTKEGEYMAVPPKYDEREDMNRTRSTRPKLSGKRRIRRTHSVNKWNNLEEWDRHLMLHPDTLEHKLHTHTDEREDQYFEPSEFEGVAKPWDKGDGSGLVFYTDALYWDTQRGDFQERTADDWDICTTEQLNDRYGYKCVESPSTETTQIESKEYPISLYNDSKLYQRNIFSCSTGERPSRSSFKSEIGYERTKIQRLCSDENESIPTWLRDLRNRNNASRTSYRRHMKQRSDLQHDIHGFDRHISDCPLYDQDLQSKGLEFAQRHMHRYGWKKGAGLGKSKISMGQVHPIACTLQHAANRMGLGYQK